MSRFSGRSSSRGPYAKRPPRWRRPTERALGRLLARVAHDSGKQGPRFHIRALAAASIIAVAVLLIGIFDTKPAYRTLTVPAQGDQTVVQILFEPAIGEREIRDSLDQLSGADVLGSPAAGLYRLSVDDPSRAEDIAEHARQLPGVRWADLER